MNINVLKYLNENLYKPHNLLISNVEEEKQNAAYGGKTFKLNETHVRFRVAKKTPKKQGQFVAFWEKDFNNKNQPYDYSEAPELLVITLIGSPFEGQFIFPKSILKDKNIYSVADKKGKMAMRVYAPGIALKSDQAKRTQAWQKDYFLSFEEEINSDALKRLYQQG